MGAIRRNRVERKRTGTGVVRRSKHDLAGLFTTLSLVAYPPTDHLIGDDPRKDYSYKKRRLRNWHHETADWPNADLPILRVPTHRQNGWNSYSVYTAGPAHSALLEEAGLLDSDQLRWMPATKVGGGSPSLHNIDLICAYLDIKRCATGFITHLDLIKRFAKELREQRNPLSFPYENTRLIPDAFFGIEYPEGYRYFFVEYDTGSESREKWLKKIHAYTYLAQHSKRLLGLERFYVLILHPSPRKHGNIAKFISSVHPTGSDLFCLQPHPPRKPTTIIDHPTDYFFTTDWQRVGRPPINLGGI